MRGFVYAIEQNKNKYITGNNKKGGGGSHQ